MKIDEQIQQMKLTELTVVTKRLIDGVKQLQHYLNQQQIKELLAWCDKDTHHHNKVESSNFDKLGNIAFIVNGTFTGVLGGWLATTGLMEFNPCWNQTVITGIVLLATIAGWYLGYYSNKHYTIQTSTENKELQLVYGSIKLMNFIKRKRLESIRKLISNINSIKLGNNQKPIKKIHLKSKSDFDEWLHDTHEIIENKLCPQTKEINLINEYFKQKIVSKMACFNILNPDKSPQDTKKNTD